MLNLTVHVVCRGIVKASVGCEAAQVCNLLRPAEGHGWGDGGWSGRSYLSWRHIGLIRGASHPNSIVAKSGAKLGCTLGGVQGDCNGDRIRLRASMTGGVLLGRRGATCIGEVSAAKRSALVVLAA
jgi:hypothetical protein